MKRLICSILAISCCLLVCETVEAQIGRGRLLKRLRDDISGAMKKPAPKPTYQPNRKVVPQPNTKRPTLNSNVNYNRTPTKAPARSTAPTLKAPTSANTESIVGSGTRKLTTPSSSYPKKGFGLAVDKNDDGQIVVSKVDPNGNAAKAGIRPGYKVLEVGGVKINSLQEYDEIAKILSNGDLMEFKIQTAVGQSRKVDVDFGTAPQPSSAVVDTKAPTRNMSSGNVNLNANSVLDRSASQNYSDEQVTELMRTVSEQQKTIQRLQQELRARTSGLQSGTRR